MPRPTRPCARCIRDLVPNCEHLGNAWDHAALKEFGTTDLSATQVQQLTEILCEYGLNRQLALDRDNGNKAEGLKATRTYKSRNTKVSDSLAGRCAVTKGPLRCMRPIGHEYEDDRGHKF